MYEFLLFRLYSPLMSWGTTAVGDERPSFAYPSKSAICGLVAAAMGVRRDEEAMHGRIVTAYGFAVRVDAPGMLLRDYHTTQVPPQRRKTVHYTRRDELRSGKLNTILSAREYRCDALYTVALWAKIDEKPPFPLSELKAGLTRPQFTLYLGRKSCPLALPLQAHVVQAENLQDGFGNSEFTDDGNIIFNGALKVAEQPILYWEPGMDGGTPLQTIVKRDQPLSRLRWQFAERTEHQGHSRPYRGS